MVGIADTMVNRTEDFFRICSSFSEESRYRDKCNLLLAGDSLKLLRRFPSHSISLIVTDPPYHTTQKSNILGDTQFKDDHEYLSWLEAYIHEWKRVLRPNGSLYCFCSPAMSARIEVLLMKEFNILSNIIWTKPNDPGFDGWKQKMKKEALRQWYPHSERIIFAEPSYPGNLFNSYFGGLLTQWRRQAGMSMKDLAEIIGAYGRVNHGGSIANWEAGRNIPSAEQYQRIVVALEQTGKCSDLPDYCDVIRAFKTTKDAEFTDIWTFPNIRPYRGKHPAEKPIALLEQIVMASSYFGDIVLDCFSGSGSSAIAALKCGRRAVSIELDEKWLGQSKRIFENIASSSYKKFPDNYQRVEMLKQIQNEKQEQLVMQL